MRQAATPGVDVARPCPATGADLSRILGSVGLMEFAFEGRVVEWRGPAPFFFVAIPEEESADIKVVAKGIEYWGQVPVTVRIRGTEFSTALFPKNGRYLLPLKEAVRKPARIALDEIVAVELRVGRQ